jgi:hypothetical protein
MSDALQPTLRSTRWQTLQRKLAESFGTKLPVSTSGSWLARVRCAALLPAPKCAMRAYA